MQAIHNNMVLDVNAVRSQATITAKAEDTKSRYLDVTLTCAGEIIPLSSHDRVVLMARETDSGRTVGCIDGGIVSGKIVVELTGALLSVPGTLECEMVVYGTDSSVLTSAHFNIIVTGRIDSTVVERETDFSALTLALSDVAGTSDRLDALTDRIQPVSLGGTGSTDIETAAQTLKVASLADCSAIASNTDMNSLTTPGTYHARNSVVSSLTNCPVDGAFKLFVMEQQPNYYIQLLIAVVGNTMWFRGSSAANTYTAWRKVLTTDAVIAESGTWNPTAESGTVTVATAFYAYDGHCVTIGTKLTCGNDITTALNLTGLPLTVRYKTVGSGVAMDTDDTVSVIAVGTKLQIRSSASMANKTIILSATYMI